MAAHGEAFVPLYRLDWRDGVWRHREGEVADPSPVRLDRRVDPGRDRRRPAPTPSPPSGRPSGPAYLAEAERMADELEARWRREPPRWNRAHRAAPTSTGWCWFRYVETEGL